jgi:thiol-disulfide isomerase/thioredoxin
MKKHLLTILIILGLVGFYFYRYKRAPDLSFSDVVLVNENEVKTSITDELGEHSVIHFYASWCGPCLKELSHFQKNAAALQELGITYIFITDDSEEKVLRMKENMPEFVKFFRINSLKEAGIYTLPTSYFLAGTEVVDKQVEAFDWSNLEELKRKTLIQ